MMCEAHDIPRVGIRGSSSGHRAGIGLAVAVESKEVGFALHAQVRRICAGIADHFGGDEGGGGLWGG